MISKRLSVFAVCAAIGAATASPILAERPVSVQKQGRSAAKPPATQQPATPSRPKPWWSDDATRKEIGLTPDQVKQIDDIYNSAKDELAADRETLDRESKELDRLINESKAANWVVLRQIDKTETQRSNYNKLFFMMLYRIHQQLTPEQRVKVREISDRNRRARDGRGGAPDPKVIR